MNAPRLLGEVRGDFLFSARVTVDFQSTYDAGVLLAYTDERNRAKLCFKFSPPRQPMVVGVVTRGLSDDCNSFVVDGPRVWLRIARIGRAFAFHASTDGTLWQFVRLFALGSASPPLVGFSAQAPTGEGCTTTFDEIAFTATTLEDLRNGAQSAGGS
ncbi:MAG: DUF1349 domain-containing protein [Acidimicrobiales bacterium]